MTPGEEFLQRELAAHNDARLQKYEVTFVVRLPNGWVEHKWTATWVASSFGDAEIRARHQLMVNEDNESKIERIELW